jgi:catechol 2,3-dioxygenase-like lactoylglutathione lyase family enzyme
MGRVIHFITLGVSDLPRSIRFYREVLDLELRRKSGDVAYLDSGGSVLTLCPSHLLERYGQLPRRTDQVGSVLLAHNVEKRSEVAALLRRALAAGGRILRESGPTDWGGHSGIFTDPDGHPWEVVFNPSGPPVMPER